MEGAVENVQDSEPMRWKRMKMILMWMQSMNGCVGDIRRDLQDVGSSTVMMMMMVMMMMIAEMAVASEPAAGHLQSGTVKT
jgi:hypothetical protein